MNLELLEAISPDTDARPVLFVHGVLHGAWCWENFLPYVAARGHSAFAVSLRGHGNSSLDGPLNRVSTADYVADVRQAVIEIETRFGQSPVLVGHSMGGFIVQKYLQRYAAPTHGVIFTALRLLWRSPWTTLKMLMTRKISPLIATDESTRAFAFSNSQTLSVVRKHRLRMCEESFRAFLDMLYRLPKSASITTPVSVIGAQHDTVFAPWEVRRTAHKYGSQAQIFPNMAHDMMLEPGWEKVADSILKCL